MGLCGSAGGDRGQASSIFTDGWRKTLRDHTWAGCTGGARSWGHHFSPRAPAGTHSHSHSCTKEAGKCGSAEIPGGKREPFRTSKPLLQENRSGEVK